MWKRVPQSSLMGKPKWGGKKPPSVIWAILWILWNSQEKKLMVC